MPTVDPKVAEILSRYGESVEGNVWFVQQVAVIYHKALERIAAKAGIRWGEPQFLIAQPDCAVIYVTGRIGKDGESDLRQEWSLGEAHLNVNYRVTGRQQAYPFAMAEKRGKDRVILKLIGLHGLVYSEDEADEFREGRPSARERAPLKERPPDSPDPSLGQEDDAARIKEKIARAKTIDQVTDLMLTPYTKKALAAMTPELREDIRTLARARLRALGWPMEGRHAH
jgi:hypothetical protein